MIGDKLMDGQGSLYKKLNMSLVPYSPIAGHTRQSQKTLKKQS